MENVDADCEEVNCVFCGKLFASIEKIQEHISQCHDGTSNENVFQASETNFEATKSDPTIIDSYSLVKSAKIYDLNTEMITNRNIDYNDVVQCPKCDLYFVNSYASRMHYEKVHVVKKRRRSTNPNGVDGIIVLHDLDNETGNPSGSNCRWGCDVCGKQFGSLKQAKVHKFKSHIQPAEKEQLATFMEQNGDTGKLTGGDLLKLREILPLSKTAQRRNKKKRLLIMSMIGVGGEVNGYKMKDEEVLDDDVVEYVAGNGHSGVLTDEAVQTAADAVTAAAMADDPNLLSASGNGYGYLNKKGHRCSHCGAIFINKEAYKRHMLQHTKESQFICQQCGEKFARVKKLKRHQLHDCPALGQTENTAINGQSGLLSQNHNGTQSTGHPASGNKGRNQSTNSTASNDTISTKDLKFAEGFLENPAIILNKGSQCVCNLCQSCFYSNQSVVKHLVLYHRICVQDGSTPLLQIKSEPSSYKPQQQLQSNSQQLPSLSQAHKPSAVAAPQRFSAPADFHPSLTFIQSCQFCNSQFASKKGLHRHLHTVHNFTGHSTAAPGTTTKLEPLGPTLAPLRARPAHNPYYIPRRIRCDFCTKRFRNAQLLDEHRSQFHPEEFAALQLEAGATDSSAPVLPPLQEKPYYLGNSSAITASGGYKVSLKRASAPAYSVPVYKKAKVPPNADGLFECDVCNKAFTCRSSLSNHVKSHFNFKNKPFSCNACQQGFMSTLTLQHHREQLCPVLVHNNGGGGGAKTAHSDDSDQTTVCSATGSGLDDPSCSQGLNLSGGGVGHDADEAEPVMALPVPVTPQPPVSSGGPAPASSLTTRATSCMHCSAVFPDRSLLEDHASKEHSNQAGEVVCIICPRSFTTYMAFRVHMTKSHGGPNGTSLKSALNAAAAAAAAAAQQLLQQKQYDSPPLFHQESHPVAVHFSGSSNSGLQPILPAACPSPGRSISRGPSPSTVHNLACSGGTTITNVTTIGTTGRIYNTRHACPNCDKDFSTSQALGNHKRACMPQIFKKI